MSEISRHSCCPECHSRDGYRLGDGRRKCRRCGKKYSRRLVRSRLPAKTLKQIALYFWLASPVATVAENLHLDRKTVCRHYALMQQGMNAEKGILDKLSSADKDDEVFCFFVGSATTWCERMAPASTQQICLQATEYSCWWSKTVRFEMSPLEFRCLVYLNQDLIDVVSNRWCCDLDKFEKILHTLWRRKRESTALERKQLMAEAVFRFNHRNNPGVTASLYQFLRF